MKSSIAKPPQPPSAHLSTEFHFRGGWAVEFIKRIGDGYAVVVLLNTAIRGEHIERLWEFPASQSNTPSQRVARRFCDLAMQRWEEDTETHSKD